MSFGLSRGRPLDPALGVVGLDALPPLPDEVLTDRRAGYLDPKQWFEHPDRPLEIEIGSGKGTFLVQQGERSPGTNYLGIEWAGEFWAYAADRVRRRGLTNIRLLHADATELLAWRCPDSIARVVHLYFSDPWPKKKHHKKRVVRDGVLAHIWRVLEPRGELRIVTDHDDYWSWMRAHFDRWTAQTPPDALETAIGRPHAGPAFVEEPFQTPESASRGELIGTNFERKFRVEGRSFHATVLRKAPDTPDPRPQPG